MHRHQTFTKVAVFFARASLACCARIASRACLSNYAAQIGEPRHRAQSSSAKKKLDESPLPSARGFVARSAEDSRGATRRELIFPRMRERRSTSSVTWRDLPPRRFATGEPAQRARGRSSDVSKENVAQRAAQSNFSSALHAKICRWRCESALSSDAMSARFAESLARFGDF
jgi:hypothetical protein